MAFAASSQLSPGYRSGKKLRNRINICFRLKSKLCLKRASGAQGAMHLKSGWLWKGRHAG